MRKYFLKIYLTARYAFLKPLLLLKRTVTFEPDSIKKILVLRYDRIGDMVLTTGFLKGLRKSFSAAEITVVVSNKNGEIIAGNPDVDKVIIWPGWRRFLGAARRYPPDLVIDCFYTYELKPALAAFLSGARLRIGFHNFGRELLFNLTGPEMGGSFSMTEHLDHLLKCISPQAYLYDPELILSEAEIKWGEEYLNNRGIKGNDLIIAVHPGGYYPSQRWPLNNFRELAEQICLKTKAKVLFLSDEDESSSVKILKQTYLDKITLINKLSLKQFMAVLHHCRLLICNNSGPLHIAAALGVPTVSAMGPTDPVLWWPRGEANMVIRKSDQELADLHLKRENSIDAISVNEMMAAVEDQLLKDFKGSI